MDLSLLIALTAAGVGFLVGLTGVGAGALMTPLLIVFFSVSPAIAIATDLIFAAVTKVVGGWVHLRQGAVHWNLLNRLWLGGILGALLGVGLIFFSIARPSANDWLRYPLAFVVILAGVTLIVRAAGQHVGTDNLRQVSSRRINHVAIGGGAGIGLAVSLTSVGAGALGMALLARLAPRNTDPRSLVGTDLLFAVPIALVAGMSYLIGGLVDASLLLNLLIGSIPGVLLGTFLASKVPSKALGAVIGVALFVAAFLVLNSSS